MGVRVWGRGGGVDPVKDELRRQSNEKKRTLCITLCFSPINMIYCLSFVEDFHEIRAEMHLDTIILVRVFREPNAILHHSLNFDF